MSYLSITNYDSPINYNENSFPYNGKYVSSGGDGGGAFAKRKPLKKEVITEAKSIELMLDKIDRTIERLILGEPTRVRIEREIRRAEELLRKQEYEEQRTRLEQLKIKLRLYWSYFLILILS